MAPHFATVASATLSLVGHEVMFEAASLVSLDVVGVFERLDDWLTLVCRKVASLSGYSS